MTTKEYNKLIDRSKNKKDGVYKYYDFYYVVKNNHFVAYADDSGECFQCFGAFVISFGRVKSYERKNKLLKWLDNTAEK